ncbi:hypothetical protein HYH03_018599 [Edaphochlamys debaryana]|uniref:Uncharacterized protein n=1 Tax=Edaphochlamys debaryana TaxID=47281 RepID=A0A835XJX9_9CHLO|nr:hypothetical protein HYH03_018599 [Edaphochlamys debaryana]|eukprot:KAG2482465.1 hypothetical protein HYH03_018599 [Edaphochlamys debaryana]
MAVAEAIASAVGMNRYAVALLMPASCHVCQQLATLAGYMLQCAPLAAPSEESSAVHKKVEEWLAEASRDGGAALHAGLAAAVQAELADLHTEAFEAELRAKSPGTQEIVERFRAGLESAWRSLQEGAARGAADEGAAAGGSLLATVVPSEDLHKRTREAIQVGERIELDPRSSVAIFHDGGHACALALGGGTLDLVCGADYGQRGGLWDSCVVRVPAALLERAQQLRQRGAVRPAVGAGVPPQPAALGWAAVAAAAPAAPAAPAAKAAAVGARSAPAAAAADPTPTRVPGAPGTPLKAPGPAQRSTAVGPLPAGPTGVMATALTEEATANFEAHARAAAATAAEMRALLEADALQRLLADAGAERSLRAAETGAAGQWQVPAAAAAPGVLPAAPGLPLSPSMYTPLQRNATATLPGPLRDVEAARAATRAQAQADRAAAVREAAPQQKRRSRNARKQRLPKRRSPDFSRTAAEIDAEAAEAAAAAEAAEAAAGPTGAGSAGQVPLYSLRTPAAPPPPSERAGGQARLPLPPMGAGGEDPVSSLRAMAAAFCADSGREEMASGGATS